MAANVVTVDRNLKPGVTPILKGFGVTLKVFFDSLFRRRYSTIEFPEKKRNVSTRYRGIHVLTEREDGTPKCVAC
jgi:NADH-quinone oxidoreductase subunit I